MATRRCDVVVIGGGSGGYVCAIRLGQLKQNVICIEKDEVGGVCLNWGCIPSKALINASNMYAKMKDQGPSMGLRAEALHVDTAAMQDWKNGIVRKLAGGIVGLLRSNKADLVRGEARVTGKRTVEVKTRDGGVEVIEASKAIVIATGSSTIELPAFKFDGRQIIGAKEAVSLTQVPRRLLVIGGGVIGLELGTVYQKLGSELTVIEATPSLLPGTDPDCTAVVEKKLVKHGAKIWKSTKAMGFERQSDGSIEVALDVGEGKREAVVCDVVLVAVGMRPNGAGLGLEELGVQVERGFVPTDVYGRTTVDGIYAVGDVSGLPMLAHKAEKSSPRSSRVKGLRRTGWLSPGSSSRTRRSASRG